METSEKAREWLQMQSFLVVIVGNVVCELEDIPSGYTHSFEASLQVLEHEFDLVFMVFGHVAIDISTDLDHLS